MILNLCQYHVPPMSLPDFPQLNIPLENHFINPTRQSLNKNDIFGQFTRCITSNSNSMDVLDSYVFDNKRKRVIQKITMSQSPYTYCKYNICDT